MNEYSSEDRDVVNAHPTLLLPSPPQITLDTTHPAVGLRSLFPSLLPSPPSDQEGGRGETTPANVLGLKLLAGPVVTMVGSKSSGRYRIQSDSLPALALFLEELVSRLEDHHRGKVSRQVWECMSRRSCIQLYRTCVVELHCCYEHIWSLLLCHFWFDKIMSKHVLMYATPCVGKALDCGILQWMFHAVNANWIHFQ